MYPDFVPVIEGITKDNLGEQKAQFLLNNTMSYFEYAYDIATGSIEGGVVDLLQTNTCVVPMDETIQLIELKSKDALIEVSEGCYRLERAIDLSIESRFLGFYLMQRQLPLIQLKTAVFSTEGLMMTYGTMYQTTWSFKEQQKQIDLQKDQFLIHYETNEFGVVWITNDVFEGYQTYQQVIGKDIENIKEILHGYVFDVIEESK